jgi:hypothetical protein
MVVTHKEGEKKRQINEADVPTQMKFMMVEFNKSSNANICFEIDGKPEEFKDTPFIAKFSK